MSRSEEWDLERAQRRRLGFDWGACGQLDAGGLLMAAERVKGQREGDSVSKEGTKKKGNGAGVWEKRIGEDWGYRR